MIKTDTKLMPECQDCHLFSPIIGHINWRDSAIPIEKCVTITCKNYELCQELKRNFGVQMFG